MSTRGLLAVVVVAGVLHGCAGFPGTSKEPLTCHSAEQCRVIVEVVNCGSGCQISVQHETVNSNGFDVVWEIRNGADQSYEFDGSKGIAFKTDAGKQVFNCHVEAGGNRYKCINRKDPGKFEYGVTLTGTPAVQPLDPWVVN